VGNRRFVTRLRRSDPSAPGVTRRRRGRGFEYVAADGRSLRDRDTIARIQALAIPPAWSDVWICADPDGHLQAVGSDADGRRQYLYHPRWRMRRDQEKFDRMLDFARALPALRRTAARHLRRRGLARERVLACSVRLLDRGLFRIGGEEYANEHGSYGLATLERRHVRLQGGGALLFDYPAKGGKRRVQAVVDREVYDVVAALKRRGGSGRTLLAYRNGRWVDVRSPDINEYIKELAGEDFTAKDFRTWHATVLAAVALAVSAEATSPTAQKRAATRAVQEVARYLGNTPAVCRSSYIDPRIFDAYRAGVTIAPALGGIAELEHAPATQGPIESAVLELLESRVGGLHKLRAAA
jgi:DNA topoisomerase IB